jgi:hypothetical protein
VLFDLVFVFAAAADAGFLFVLAAVYFVYVFGTCAI